MTLTVRPMDTTEVDRAPSLPDAGVGALRTDRGNLPLDRLDVTTKIVGLIARTVVATDFVNVYDTALEATYVFPLPDRAAVTGMTMTADDRTVEAELKERGAARETYDRAIQAGQRASIAEEERPDVFTMRVGNIMPGERVTVELRLVGQLPYEDGAATFRFPLVVAPRYVPGNPLPGPSVGSGQVLDTDAVPDASRITPPVLLPGFPSPLRLSIDVEVDPAGLELGDVRSSLHTITAENDHIRIGAGERANRDFILRLPYSGAAGSGDGSGVPGTAGGSAGAARSADGAEAAVAGGAVIAVPDAGDDEDDREQGTYQVTIMPPAGAAAPRPKDVVLLLDRSGSMGGWKMVAARRAAARVVDTLTGGDRFAVLTFDHQVDRPADLGTGLADATDRNRFRAVEHLARADARGGTELMAPLHDGLALLGDSGSRDRVLVLVTDGQVGNEDQILHDITPLIGATRIHTVGIDQAVNAGFLGRLASLGGGRCELVESEDRLDEAMEHIHRRIGSPVLTGVTIAADALGPLDDTRSPSRLPGVYPGVPLVVTGRYAGTPGGSVTVTGHTRDDEPWSVTLPVQRRDEAAVTAQWARARLRDLEDRYVAGASELESRIVALSLRFGVLCRFTAFVAVDSRVVNEDGETRRVTQPVEFPAGWELPDAPGRAGPMPFTLAASAAPMRAAEGGMLGGSAAMKTFAAVPSMLGRSGRPGGVPSSSGLSIEDVRSLAALEASRLRDSHDRPARERRDLLADLASRLRVLLSGLSGPEYASLHTLVEMLTSGDDLDTRWAEATRVLTEFAGDARAPQSQRHTRRAFWKR